MYLGFFGNWNRKWELLYIGWVLSPKFDGMVAITAMIARIPSIIPRAFIGFRYVLGLYTGIMEKNMETTIIHWGGKAGWMQRLF